MKFNQLLYFFDDDSERVWFEKMSTKLEGCESLGIFTQGVCDMAINDIYDEFNTIVDEQNLLEIKEAIQFRYVYRDVAYTSIKEYIEYERMNNWRNYFEETFIKDLGKGIIIDYLNNDQIIADYEDYIYECIDNCIMKNINEAKKAIYEHLKGDEDVIYNLLRRESQIICQENKENVIAWINKKFINDTYHCNI